MNDVIRYFCRGENCRNEARYHVWGTTAWSDGPQYCGLCDLRINAGRGKLASEIEAEVELLPDRGLLWYREEYMRLDRGLRAAHAAYERSATALRDELKDAHDLGKRLLFERNSFEGLYKNEQALRERAATTFDRALSVARLERDAARAAAADYHKDCISGEEIVALRAIGPPCGCAACRLFWSKK